MPELLGEERQVIKPGPIILCVDDESLSLELLEAVLTPHGYEVLLARNRTEALELFSKHNVDLVLLDVKLPGESGYEICRWIRSNVRYQSIPVVTVTSLTSTEERIKSIESGADDFISKPFDHLELLTRIGRLLKMKGLHDRLDVATEELQYANEKLTTVNDELHTRNAEMAGANTELQRLNELLGRLATTDKLTGVSNRYKLDEALKTEVVRSQRFAIPLSIIMFDIDHFKAINDTFGHPAGDEVLRELAGLVRNYVRVHDMFARWGGEEFMLMMTNSAMDHAWVFAEKLRSVIEKHAFLRVDRLTCSFGVAQLASDESSDIFCRRVDEAMYAAKRRGRNRIAGSGAPDQMGKPGRSGQSRQTH